MDPPEEVTLWKAPQAGRNPAAEVMTGFDPVEYPGDGPYFALDRELAEEWQRIYGNGLQVFHIPRALYDDLLRQGVIRPDAYYPGRSCHVLPSGLSAFNNSIAQGSPNVYLPQQPAENEEGVVG
jgi:hypothetical protein